MWALVRDSGGLDLNSPYTYLLFGHYFRDTCAVAEEDGRIQGLIVGFRPPPRPDALFIWQITVADTLRGRGAGRRMLNWLAAHQLDDGVRYLEATVTPSNIASQRMFRGYARGIGVPCEETPLFPANAFPGDGHEEERLFRIGPYNDAAIAYLRSPEATREGETTPA